MKLRAFFFIIFAMLFALCPPAWCQGVWELSDSRIEVRKDTSETPGEWVPAQDSVAMRKVWYNANAGKSFQILASFAWQGIPLTLASGQSYNLRALVDQQANNETGYNSSIKIYAGLAGGVEADGPFTQATWREPVCQHQAEGQLQAPAVSAEGTYVIRVLCKVAGDSFIAYYTYHPAGGSAGQKRPSVAGEWSGVWRNSVGESGGDVLLLHQDANGALSGTWSGYIPVQGHWVSPSKLELQGSTANRAFDISGHLEGDELVLRYTARRLDAAGSYTGESRFRRR